MKKFVLGFLLVLAAIALCTLFYVDVIARNAVETGSQRAFGTPVRVGGVRLGLMDASFDLEGYEVTHPDKFESPYLFGIGEANLAVGYDGLGRDRIVADRLHIDGIRLNLEMAGGDTNFGPVLQHLRGLQGGAEGEEPAGPKLVIRQLELSGAQVRIAIPGIQRTATLPAIQLENVGGEDGVWLYELAAIVLGAVVDQAVASGDLPTRVSGILSQGLQGVPNALAREARQRVDDEVEEAADGLLDRAKEALGEDGDG